MPENTKITGSYRTVRFVLLDVDYVTRNREAVVRLFGKITGQHQKGTPQHIIALDKSFKPYLYVVPSSDSDIDTCTRDLSNLRLAGLIQMEKVSRDDLGKLKEVIKVTMEHPQDIPKLRDRIRNLSSVGEIREHDIPFYRRYLIDKGLSPMNIVEVQGKVLSSKSSKSSSCLLQVEGSPVMLDDPLPDFSILSFDIEVYNPHGIPQSDRDPIIMISFASNHGFQKVFSLDNSTSDFIKDYQLNFVEWVSSEKELLQKFTETINSIKPDFILGYNSDGFDFPYIRDRAANLGVPLNIGVDGSCLKFTRVGASSVALIRGRIHIDLYPNIRRYLHLNRHTLKNVYTELFGEEKMDIPGDEIHTYWEEGGSKLETLLHYSLDDSVSVIKIGTKMLPLSIELTRIVGQPLFEVARMASGRHVEWYLIKKSFECKNLVPNKPPASELARREDIHTVGGYVKEPLQGLHENIVYFDFRSLYPSIIISKNISPDTHYKTQNEVQEKTKNTENYHITPEHGFKFRRSPVGFIPQAMDKILKDRIRIKSKMKNIEDSRERQVLDVQQQALKRMASTIYGLYNHSSFRWYSMECSEAITAWGRDFLKKTMKDSEKHGFKPVYADTDGFFAVYEDK